MIGAAGATLLEAALAYAELGLKVFPIADGDKRPIATRGWHDATDDRQAIIQWWTEHPNARIGLPMRLNGLFGIDVDVDVAGGKRGDETLAKLEAKYGALPRTNHQRSGRGGQHFVMRDPAPAPVPSRDVHEPGDDGWTRQAKFGGACRANLDSAGCGLNVDTRASHYIVVEPSGSYRWLAFDLTKLEDVPAAWIPLIRKPAAELSAPGDSDAWLLPSDAAPLPAADLERLERELRELGPRGQGGGTTFAAVLRVYHDWGLSREQGDPILARWNQRCGLPRPDEELRRQVHNIAASGRATGKRGHKRSDLSGAEQIARASYEPCAVTLPEATPVASDGAEPLEHAPEATPVANAREGAAVAAPQAPWLPKIEPAPRVGVRASAVIDEIRAGSKLPTVSTPWPEFNARTGGLEIGSITLAVGGSGSGKTSQAAQLAAHHAKTSPVVYYLGEMTRRMFVARIIGQALKRSWQAVLHGEVSDLDMHRVLDPLNLVIVPVQPTPDAAIEAITRELDGLRADATPGIPLLMVDYVQLLVSPGADMRQSMISAVRGIQELTESREIATWVLSQSSRTGSKAIRAGATDSVDLMDTGAESAELERAATLQFALSFQPKDDTRIHEVTLAVGKRRFGGPTKLYYDYDGETGLWTERRIKIVNQIERDRRDEILDEIDKHHGQEERCPCAHLLTANAFTTAGGIHKVVGNRAAVLTRLKAMVGDREIVNGRSGYHRAGAATPLATVVEPKPHPATAKILRSIPPSE